jgi:hypothetical protein
MFPEFYLQCFVLATLLAAANLTVLVCPSFTAYDCAVHGVHRVTFFTAHHELEAVVTYRIPSCALVQVWVPNLSLAGPDPDEEKLVTVAATKCLTECGDVYGTRALWEQLRAALDEKLKGKPLDAGR